MHVVGRGSAGSGLARKGHQASTAVVTVSGPGCSRCPRWPASGRGLGRVGTPTPHQQGASREQRAGADRGPGQRGAVRIWGPDAANPTPPPGAPHRAGDTHLRRRHPARPSRSSGNSARLLPRPRGLGRGRRPERTNQRRPSAPAANGRLPSIRSAGSLRRASGSPYRARSGPTVLGLNGGGLNH